MLSYMLGFSVFLCACLIDFKTADTTVWHQREIQWRDDPSFFLQLNGILDCLLTLLKERIYVLSPPWKFDLFDSNVTGRGSKKMDVLPTVYVHVHSV